MQKIYLVRACLYIGAKVPDRVQMVLARYIGRLAWWTNFARRRRVCLTNLQIAYATPNKHNGHSVKTRQQIQRLAKANYVTTVHAMFVTASLWMRIPGWLESRLYIQNGEAFKQFANMCFANNKPVFLIGYHSVYIEIIGVALTMLGLRRVATYRKEPDAKLEQIIKKGRDKYFDALIAKNNIRGLVRELRQRPACTYIAVDINTRASMEFTQMYGRPATTSIAVARVARLFDAPLVGYWVKRESGGRYLVHFMLDNIISPSTDFLQQAERMNDLIAEAIEQAPEQYLWLHRRYKTQPKGMVSPYSSSL